MGVLTSFTWQHLRRHWRLFGVVLVTMLIGTTLLASLPLFASVIASDNLTLTLSNVAVPGRNIELTAAAVKTREHF